MFGLMPLYGLFVHASSYLTPFVGSWACVTDAVSVHDPERPT